MKIIITDIHEGTCDVCLQPVIGYQAKIESFAALLCSDCLQLQWNRRKEMQEAAERPLLKGTDEDGKGGSGGTSPKPQQNVRVAG